MILNYRTEMVVKLDDYEKKLIRDAAREAENGLMAELRALGAPDKVFGLLDALIFLVLHIDNVVYGSGLETAIVHEYLLQTAQEVIDLLELTVHPTDAAGFVIKPAERYDLSSPSGLAPDKPRQHRPLTAAGSV